MENIYAKGKCKICGVAFNHANDYECKEHGNKANRFFISIYHEGERIWRATTLDGKTLDSFEEASGLYRTALSEKRAKTFNPTVWKSKIALEYSFNRLIDKWLSEKIKLMEQGKLAPSYVPQLRRYVTSYYVPYYGNKDVRQIFSLKGMYDNLSADLSPKYQKNIMDALKGFFLWLKEDKLISDTPRFMKVEVPEYAFQVISHETQQEILRHIPKEHKPIFTFLFYQGIRPSEVRALKWKDINGDVATIRRTWSHSQLRETTKTKRVRDIFLFPETVASLPRRTFPENFVFTHGVKLIREYSKTYLNDIFQRACEAVGVNITLYEATKHSWCTSKYQSGIDINLIQSYQGHTSAKMTKRYTKINHVDAFRERSKVVEIRKEGGNNDN